MAVIEVHIANGLRNELLFYSLNLEIDMNTTEDLKQELAAVELEQRFEMVNAAPDLVDVEITNFICSPKEAE